MVTYEGDYSWNPLFLQMGITLQKSLHVLILLYFKLSYIILDYHIQELFVRKEFPLNYVTRGLIRNLNIGIPKMFLYRDNLGGQSCMYSFLE